MSLKQYSWKTQIKFQAFKYFFIFESETATSQAKYRTAAWSSVRYESRRLYLKKRLLASQGYRGCSSGKGESIVKTFII